LEPDLAKATEHVKDHETNVCNHCGNLFPKTAFEQHLVVEHHYIACPYCASAAVDREDLEEHIKEHKLTTCPECSVDYPWSDLEQHKAQIHGWKQCPFCTELIPEAEIREHILQNHIKVKQLSTIHRTIN
jgi:DNA-directed RNA polymerase subunit RPC12/RpoP